MAPWLPLQIAQAAVATLQLHFAFHAIGPCLAFLTGYLFLAHVFNTSIFLTASAGGAPPPPIFHAKRARFERAPSFSSVFAVHPSCVASFLSPRRRPKALPLSVSSNPLASGRYPGCSLRCSTLRATNSPNQPANRYGSAPRGMAAEMVGSLLSKSIGLGLPNASRRRSIKLMSSSRNSGYLTPCSANSRRSFSSFTHKSMSTVALPSTHPTNCRPESRTCP